MNSKTKLDRLQGILQKIGRVLVAYSGGVDSTFLACVAARTDGVELLAVTADSAFMARREIERAVEVARLFNIPHRILNVDVLGNPTVCGNPADRCYHCKHVIFTQLKQIALENAGMQVCDGSNTDDSGDYRPGHRALHELEVRSPLREAGLSKADIRELSRDWELPTWNLPAAACLASRLPYGTEITAARLQAIEKAEALLMDLGLRTVRVRCHGDVARIETDPGEFGTILNHRETITTALRGVGFAYVALDLSGYRTGSLNETLGTETTSHQ